MSYFPPTVMPSYSAAITEFALDTTPTTIFSIFGSASKVVKITRLRVIVYETAQAIRTAKILRLSSALTGGTSAAMTPVKHDTNNATATATPLNWTADPGGGGTVVGSIDEINITSVLAAGATPPSSHDSPGTTVFNFWNDLITQAITLRGTSEGLAVDLGGAALDAGRKASVYVEWIEF